MAFEDLVVVDRALPSGRRVDLGRLAEDLVFYGKVHIQVGRDELEALLRGIGPETALELMKLGSLNILYSCNIVGTHTSRVGVIELYKPVVVSTDNLEMETAVHAAIRAIESDRGRADGLARRILDVAEECPHDPEICTATRAFLEDAEATEAAVRGFFEGQDVLPVGHPPVRFRPTRQDGDVFTVDTNIDFAALNAQHKCAQGPLDPARLIASLAGARSKIQVASERHADLDSTSNDLRLLSTQVAELVDRRLHTKKSTVSFQEVILGNANAIGQAITSGERTYADLVDVVERGKRFRAWLSRQAPDADILHEYYAKISEESWISSQPAKVFRWAIATGLSVAVSGEGGLVVGAVYGALDSFVIERIADGWTPRQFVDAELSGFVSLGK